MTGKNFKSLTIKMTASQQSWKEVWVWGRSALYPIWEDSLVNCPNVDFEPISYLTPGLFLGFSCISFFELIYWTSIGILRTFIWRHHWVVLCKALLPLLLKTNNKFVNVMFAYCLDLFLAYVIPTKSRAAQFMGHYISITWPRIISSIVMCRQTRPSEMKVSP